MSRVTPLSHRQEKIARKECLKKSTRKFLLTFIRFTPRPSYQGLEGGQLLFHESPASRNFCHRSPESRFCLQKGIIALKTNKCKVYIGPFY